MKVHVGQGGQRALLGLDDFLWAAKRVLKRMEYNRGIHGQGESQPDNITMK